MNDYCADEVLIESLLPLSPEEILQRIFERYPVKCIDLGKLDHCRFDRLAEELKHRKKKKKAAVEGLLATVREASGERKNKHPVVDRIKERLAKDPAEPLSIPALAKEIGISQTYMMHLFQRVVRRSITAYRLQARLKHAASHLAEGDLSLSQIALLCGFSSASHFGKCFREEYRVTPGEYRKLMKTYPRTNAVLQRASDRDLILYTKLKHFSLWKGGDPYDLPGSSAVEITEVSHPTEEFGFLHEAAVIGYHGKLFCAWYNNPQLELKGRCPIRFATSSDGGQSFSKAQTVADDPSGRILYCPPVFGIDEDRLYLLLNTMVGPDRMHSLDLYRYDEKENRFVFLWSRPLPFKLNTNVYRLPNGKLFLPGRIAEPDQVPTVPAALISDSGRIDAPWRLVRMAPDDRLPDGSRHACCEQSAVVAGEKIYVFCRNDLRRVPLLYLSEDCGETWSEPMSIDLPFADSKIYSGTLSDGRDFVIGNLDHARSHLALFLTEGERMVFTKGITLQKGFYEPFGYGIAWHYPAAWEENGRLYVVSTVSLDSDTHRGAVLFTVDLKEL